MNITKDTAVTLAYRISDASNGRLLESGTMAYLHGGYDNLFAKVEAALDGQAVAHQVKIDLAVEDAFGERDESLVRTIPRSDFPPGVKLGGQLQGPGPQGPVAYRVVKIKGPEVHLDANHRLAGYAVHFAATVKAVRAATREEIAHRHVHGVHGHQH